MRAHDITDASDCGSSALAVEASRRYTLTSSPLVVASPQSAARHLAEESGDLVQHQRARLSSGLPPATTRSKDASKVLISDARPYNLSGISSRSGVSCSPSGNSSMRPRLSHSLRQRRRSRSRPTAVWYRSSAVLASNFITRAETRPGIFGARSPGGTGCLAIWQCTHSIGSEAVKGRLPVSISYSVTPRE
jgi:hypothetical protein